MLNRYETTILAISSFGNPSRLDWVIATFLLIVQQGAFIGTAYELLYPGESRDLGANPFNTASILISILLLSIGCARVLPLIRGLVLRNPYSLLYIVIVLSSTIWSLHPELSLQRGCAYLLTIGVAGFIAVRFTTQQALAVLARSFEICGVCSLIFVLLSPDAAIMSGGDLEGNWRGIYPHKNVFGSAMAVAVFVQLQLISSSRGRNVSAYAWAIFYFVLLILSRSTTSLLRSLFCIFVMITYIVWSKNKMFGYGTLFFTFFVVVLLSLATLTDSEYILGLIGKDPTLTGRTDIWDAVAELISQKPVLGWGYRAMWVPTDLETMWLDVKTGEWGVPSAHNTFLEITLELGLLGLTCLIFVICTALWRGIRCCALGLLPFGIFSLAFFIAMIGGGQTEETMGINQEINWLVFNILSFLAGDKLAGR